MKINDNDEPIVQESKSSTTQKFNTYFDTSYDVSNSGSLIYGANKLFSSSIISENLKTHKINHLGKHKTLLRSIVSPKKKRWIISGSRAGEIQMTNQFTHKQPLQCLNKKLGSVTVINFFNDENLIFVGGSNFKVYIFDLKSRIKIINTFHFGQSIFSGAVSNDNNSLIVCGWRNEVEVYSLPDYL